MISRQQFTSFIMNPGVPDENMTRTFEEIVSRYPYCQTAQTMLTFCLNKTDHQRFQVQLGKCAAIAGNRRILKELLEKETLEVSLANEHLPELIEPLNEQEESTPEESLTFTWEFDVNSDLVPGQESVKAEIKKEQYSPDELLAIVRQRLEEIAEEKNKMKESQSLPVSVHPQEFNIQERKSKQEIIDRFIADEPVISKPQPGFFKPSELVTSNPFEDDDIISETLAILYAQQGNVSRAKRIYEKLSLLNQEKSRYFATQIEKLNKNS